MRQMIIGNIKYSTDSELITADNFRGTIVRGLNLEVSDLINWFNNTQFWNSQEKKYIKAVLKIEQVGD